KYSIRESIEDGTTLPLHYALAPNDLLVDREVLEKEFLEVAELEGVSDVEELNRVLDRAVNLKNMLKNRARVERVAAHVARHFRENVEPTGYKAFLVGADREACTLYKRELDKRLPPEYSEVVISAAHNDPPELAEFHLREDEEQRVRKSFRKSDELPKILIVTEKLLTGYDAPVLYCMYLDKPMRDHVLLQAIARVNRPHEDEQGRRKPAGFVLDFVGIFDKLERALAFDSEEVRGVVEGVEVLRHRFAVLMDDGRGVYLSLAGGSLDDKAVEAVLQRFRDREERQAFYRFFRELEELHEILSPDPFLRPFVGDFERLTRMYQLLRSAYEPNVPVDKTLMRKTARLVEEHTGTGLIGEPRAGYALNPATLEQLARANDKPETVRIFNLLKEVRKLVDEGNGVAYLVPIGERAEAIAESFEERQSTTGEALRDLEKLAGDLKKAEGRRTESDLSDEAFAVSLYLEGEGVDGAEEVAGWVSATFEAHPHWRG
ncbi:MAG: type I restriction enzyme subunit R domain-containing protein, partial [Rubrobacter sp.]